MQITKAYFQRLVKKFFYRKSSHYLLNYLTLSIKDKEVTEELFKFRLKWQDAVFKVCCVLVAVDLILTSTTLFVTKDNNAVQGLMSVNTLGVMITWWLLRRFFHKQVYVVPILYLNVMNLVLNLVVRD